MKKYCLLLLAIMLSGLASVSAQVVTYRTLSGYATVNGIQGVSKEDRTGRITINPKKKVITARVKSGFFRYEKESDVKFVIDSVKKEKAEHGTVTIYSCHYTGDNNAFITVTISFDPEKKQQVISFLNDNNAQVYVVK
jgi:hypothetical protein